MTRQFDDSLQRLGKILYNFFREEGIESYHEKEALIKTATDQIAEGYILARSVQAGADGIARIRKQEKPN